MKLRNKETGEIGWLYCDHISVPKKMTVFSEDENLSAPHWDYTSLAELNKEWEDVPESKGIIKVEKSIVPTCVHIVYATEEEAEKAVEKLEAWKRLKDKGFRFKKWESYEETSGLSFPDRHIVNSYTAIFDFNKPCRKHEIENEVKADLDVLFGGEE